jgi:hypothetical protein
LWSDEERSAVAAIDATRVRTESRAALSTTGAQRGFMIPFYLDPQVLITSAGALNPYRQICNVQTIPVNVWHGFSSLGISAEWIAEASEMTDASPSFFCNRPSHQFVVTRWSSRHGKSYKTLSISLVSFPDSSRTPKQIWRTWRSPRGREPRNRSGL